MNRPNVVPRTETTVSRTTRSPEETERLGEQIGRLLRSNDVVALIGELGAGKTCLVRGIARGVGSPERVTSPSFVLIQEYRGGRFPVYHLDFYRLNGPDEVADLDVPELFESGGVSVVEWADRAPELFPERTLWIRIEIVGESERRWILSGDARLQALESAA